MIHKFKILLIVIFAWGCHNGSMSRDSKVEELIKEAEAFSNNDSKISIDEAIAKLDSAFKLTNDLRLKQRAALALISYQMDSPNHRVSKDAVDFLYPSEISDDLSKYLQERQVYFHAREIGDLESSIVQLFKLKELYKSQYMMYNSEELIDISIVLTLDSLNRRQDACAHAKKSLPEAEWEFSCED